MRDLFRGHNETGELNVASPYVVCLGRVVPHVHHPHIAWGRDVKHSTFHFHDCIVLFGVPLLSMGNIGSSDRHKGYLEELTVDAAAVIRS